MQELRLVRREDRTLIVATDAGEEFRLIVDDAILGELRQLSRRDTGPLKASPREIQALVRAGKSRAEIAEITGVEEAAIERYEAPVLAERTYILELAHDVPVRTSAEEGSEQQFGAVIAERLIGLGSEVYEWSSWRDDEAGWMIGLEFISHDVEHRAVWSFDHRKGVLAPLSPDAVTLSKQGEVGDRLIPKLRAVDDPNRSERFDSGAFDPDQLLADLESSEGTESTATPHDTVGSGELRSGTVSPDHPSTGSIPTINMEAEFARRRSIDERAIKSPEPELPDLGQTADLLDALRRRRGERSGDLAPAPQTAPEGGGLTPPVQLPGFGGLQPDEDSRSAEGPQPETLQTVTPQTSDQTHEAAATADTRDADSPEAPAEAPTSASQRRGRGRPAIPSWDDILFGTRSEEDPS